MGVPKASVRAWGIGGGAAGVGRCRIFGSGEAAQGRVISCDPEKAVKPGAG